MASHKVAFVGKHGKANSVRNLLRVLLLLVMVIGVPNNSVQGAAIDHVNSLLEFRRSNCILPDDWSTQSDPCTANWTGITCNLSSSGVLEITGIHLMNRSCDGSIPRSLVNITTLESLELIYNNFTDKFPAFLNVLPQLKRLDLNNNTIFGPLPPEIGSFTSLEVLNVSNNGLEGLIPYNLTTLKNLRNVRLRGNAFVGSLPATLHEMESLVEFNVSRNQLGAELTFRIGLLPRIEILDISRNFFKGSVPKEIGNLSTLTYLDLNSNGLSGELPDSIANLTRLRTLGLRNNTFSGRIPKYLGTMTNLTRLFLRINYFHGDIPPQLGNLVELDELYLNDNKLEGGIPGSFSKLTKLRYFHCGGNHLKGKIPDFWSQFKILKNLNLSSNAFTGSIPRSLVDIAGSLNVLALYGNNLSGEVPEGLQAVVANHGAFLISDNPGLCGNGTIFNTSVYAAGLRPCVHHHVPTVMIVVIMLAVCVIICCSIAIALLLLRKRRIAARAKWEGMLNSGQERGAQDGDGPSLTVPSFKPSGTHYTVQEIEKATSNFTLLLGRGGYGPVYKAVFPDGVEAAVKVQQKHTKQGDQEFITEIELLGRLHHKKLVNLLGYCTNDVVRMLVYEFKSNGSLHSHLHGSDPGKISWPLRMKIALDVAEGLQYLHHGADPPVIHRDIKSGNILLDENFNAFIADFGISKEGPPDMGNVKTVGVTSFVKGTPGYLDPEYFYSRKLTRKSDVYSFGVLLLEILTGYNPCSPGINVSEFGRSIKDTVDVEELVDPHLQGQYDNKQAYRMAIVARRCVHRDVDHRPRMKVVLGMLENQIPLTEDVTTGDDPGEAQCSTAKFPKICEEDTASTCRTVASAGESFCSASPGKSKADRLKSVSESDGADEEEKVITIVNDPLTTCIVPR